jgi:hypothetical protein
MRSLQQRSLKRPSRRAADELNDLFEMANLSPTLTGLVAGARAIIGLGALSRPAGPWS